MSFRMHRGFLSGFEESRKSITESGEGKRRSAFLRLGLAFVAAEVAFALFFSLRDSWAQIKVVVLLTFCAISIPLFEYANNGRWFPALSPSKGLLKGLVRALAAIAGVALALSVVGFCWAFGSGNWKLSMAGFVLGMFSTSFLLMRYAITGIWFLNSGRCRAGGPDSLAVK